MGTFLTTPRMSPELAARVVASVTGKPVRLRHKASPRLVLLWRAVGLAVLGGLVVAALMMQRSHRDALDGVRQSLLSQLETHAAQLTEEHKTLIVRTQAMLAQLSGPYPGDLVADAIRGNEALSAALAQPLLYVRGPIAGFASTAGLAGLAEASSRDSFVLCLLDAPTERSEKALRSRARAALAGGARTAALAHVERLNSVLVGIPLLAPEWAERVRRASDAKELSDLRATLLKASLPDAVRAAKARYLLAVLDEAKDGNGPTELDGAYRHYARVVLIDLANDTPLLRARKLVDPDWIGETSRVGYASGIIGCELALEVRAEATGIPAPSRPRATL